METTTGIGHRYQVDLGFGERGVGFGHHAAQALLAQWDVDGHYDTHELANLRGTVSVAAARVVPVNDRGRAMGEEVAAALIDPDCPCRACSLNLPPMDPIGWDGDPPPPPTDLRKNNTLL